MPSELPNVPKDRKVRKAFLIALIALIFALIGYVTALMAQETADINNVFEVVVNNTNLAPSFVGQPPGTGERVTGVTYYANASPIEIFLFAHAMSAGETAEVHLYINGTSVVDVSGKPIGGGEQNNKSVVAIIPKGASYMVEFNSFHHYEWREYPILSGKNGTLSINQTVIGGGNQNLSQVLTLGNDAQNQSLNNVSGINMTGNINMNNHSVLNVLDENVFGNLTVNVTTPVTNAGWTVFTLGRSTTASTFRATVNDANGAFNFRTNIKDDLTQDITGSGWSFAMQPKTHIFGITRIQPGTTAPENLLQLLAPEISPPRGMVFIGNATNTSRYPVTIYNMTGTGTAFVCVDSTGMLIRSTVSCDAI